MSILQLAQALLDSLGQVSHGTVSSRVPRDSCKKLPAGQLGRLGRIGPRDAAPWGATDWQAYHDERAGTLEYVSGLSRPEANAGAWESCIAEWMSRHPVRSDPGRCVACGETGVREALLPYGMDDTGHAWLHATCWSAWYAARKADAASELRALGVVSDSRGHGAAGAADLK